MGVLFLFVPLSMLVVGLLVWAAFWAIKNNQFEDMEGPAHRILLDDDDPRIPTNDARAAKPSQQAQKPGPDPAADETAKSAPEQARSGNT